MNGASKATSEDKKFLYCINEKYITVYGMGECGICGKNGEKLSLLSAHHKELGRVLVCRECWVKLYDENRMVAGSTGSGSSCPTCR
jgi:hypothetical protein